MPGGDVDKGQLMRYIELEKEIQALEARNVLKQFDECNNSIKDLNGTIASTQTTLDDQKKQTKKEKADVDRMKEKSIKEMIVDQSKFQQELSREQEEYLEAKNKEEVTAQLLEGLKKQQCELEAKVKELKPDADKLKAQYVERDTLLSDIFNGEYGSEEENRLEAQFDMLMEKKQRISTAYTKWSSAKVLLAYAVRQLNTSVQKWEQVGNLDNSNYDLKYKAATQARNNAIAANQNVESAENYLGKAIKFPYVTKPERETLMKAVTHIYIDMQTPDRHCHAKDCYVVTWKRASALMQWFDNVIQQTIQLDLKKASQEAKSVEQQLRAERIKLIRAKVEESGESTKDLNIAGDDLDKEELDLKAVGIYHADGVADDPNLPDMKKMSMQQQQQQQQQQQEDMRPPPTPIPLCDLAPAPNTEDLFGNIDDLKKQHKKHEEDFSKAQQMNKTRMEQGLHAKLQQRRCKKINF